VRVVHGAAIDVVVIIVIVVVIVVVVTVVGDHLYKITCIGNYKSNRRRVSFEVLEVE
jgi:hypothetical protein